MRTIEKGEEPLSLRVHRKRGGRWDDYTHQDDVRHALLREQGHLCCFCMRRIVVRGMKVAHWASQSAHPNRTTDWENLLGACKGGDGEPRDRQHCDTAQGDTPIKLHPADRAQRCERLVHYRADGEVASDDPEIHKDLTRTLNLNYAPLKTARKRIYDVLLTRLTSMRRDYWPREMIAEELERWKRRNEAGQLREYCQVAIYFLEKKLKRND